jgi:tetratricopeptide (TPR) repeat protein
MTFRVTFRLRRSARAGPVAALLIPTRDPTVLLHVCAQCRLQPQGRVFDVAGGYLLETEQATCPPLTRATRLRALAEGFYLPVDAELIPALLDDELSGLVRDWGLVLLQGDRALFFDRHAPVPLTDLLASRARPPRAWTSLPEPRRLAERLTQVALVLPESPPEALYRAYQKDLLRQKPPAGPSRGTSGSIEHEANFTVATPATADTREGSFSQTTEHAGTWRRSPAARLKGLMQTLSGVFIKSGHALAGLQERAQWEWIDHSALLRRLVREFREGDSEKALRRAIPIRGPDEPAVPTRAEWLPVRRAIYNLYDALRRPSPSETRGVLPAQANVVRDLEREYRKAADRALRTGDFRRAAYIFGMLLRDDRMAANALQRGGLHRDAALLYLKKVGDRSASARAFEAAGEVDRAVALYRQVGDHESAGDVLRRIGDEDAAIAEYTRAAQLHASLTPPAFFRAGGLLEHKARRTDLAIEYLSRGWDARPSVDAISCALELARIHAERGSIEPIRAILDQAAPFFESIGSDHDASVFYNGFVAATTTLALITFAEEVRDRALLALAARLRRNLQSGHLSVASVSTFLGRSSLWPPSLLSDAEFATSQFQVRCRTLAQRAGDREESIYGLQLGYGTVTAVCQASHTGDLFVAFASGAVRAYSHGPTAASHVADYVHPVTALAADPEGSIVAALRRLRSGTVISCSVKGPDGTFRACVEHHIGSPSLTWLTPIVPHGTERLVGVGGGSDLLIIDACSGIQRDRLALAHRTSAHTRIALLLPRLVNVGTNPSRQLSVLAHDGRRWVLADPAGSGARPTPCDWNPCLPTSSSLRSLPLVARHIPPIIELVGLDESGAIHAAQFRLEDNSLELLVDRTETTEGGYLAATLLGTNSVVGVAATHIDWLGYHRDRFRVTYSLNQSFPLAVACFTTSAADEIVIVCSNGFLARVPSSRRPLAISP